MANPRAGQPAQPEDLVDLPHLVTAYYTTEPDPDNTDQQVVFGTSGHRGSALDGAFNEAHILAITQAIVEYRAAAGTTGPLFIGRDTHGLSEPAWSSALEVLAANDVIAMIDAADRYTPTPAISYAILSYNHGRADGLADGIVVTPSHNPPRDGGFKYNPPNGGPADSDVTNAIAKRANEILRDGLSAVKRVPLARALQTTWRHDYLDAYVDDLPSVVDIDAIRASGVRIGADPLGGASVDYWGVIAERHGLDLTVVNPLVDATWRFMTLDHDGKIRMDCSSPDAMASLIANRDHYQIATGNDADADRHGIVTPDAGLLNPNHYLAVAVDYLYTHRPSVGGGAGRVQMVRRRSVRRNHWLRRRRVSRCLVPAPRRIGVDHRQGRDHPGVGGRRDPRCHRRDAVAALSGADRELRRPDVCATRRARQPRAEGPAGQAVARSSD
ncbi:MAG: phosphoglucomutase [Mycobacterium sp.]|nr:phosphoglucomutase [Mycobacterium sp.]